MKNGFFSLVLIGFIVSSCGKEYGNKGTMPHISSVENLSSINLAAYREQGTEETLRYVAEDGSNALATFVKTPKGNYISIRSNNKTINVKEKEVTSEKTIYEENTVNIKVEGDSLIITQDNAIIALKKAKGQ